MDAPPLRETQQLFLASLVTDAQNPNFTAIVDDSFGAARPERIAVYTEAYFLRLQAVLLEDFPRTVRLLDEDALGRIIRRYIAEHPSRNPSAIWFGRDFPAFLARTCLDMPWLAPVAKLEWSRIEAFCAPESPVLTLNRLAATPPDTWATLCFECVPSATRLDSRWPADRLWDGESVTSVEVEATSLRVWRNVDHQVRHARMDHREAAAFTRMQQREPFAAIVEVFGDEPEAAASAASLLGRWLADGLISDVVRRG
jgi:hypothetical protein